MHIFASLYTLLEVILTRGGYWIIFLVSFLEAVPLLGSFVPGHALVILAGFLARVGVLNVYMVILVTAIGAICGDIMGYLLGKKYGYGFLVRFGKYFLINEEHLAKARAVMEKHTGKALIIGRFSPVTRALTPFLAGAGDLHLKKFWTYNLIGGISWAAISVFVGYLFGASYEVASKYIGKFIFIATVLSILIIWGYQFANSRRHIFAKYHLYTLVINIGALYVFFKTIQDALSSESFLAQLDVWVNLKMVALANPVMITFMTLVSAILSPTSLSIAGLVLFLYLAYKKRWYHMLLVAAGLAGGGIINSLIKILVARIRPENALIKLTDLSFPSGHATMSVIFFILIIYIFSSRITNKYIREIFGTINICLFLLVGISRIYLNVHWLSDVVAGFALGIFWLTLLMLIFKFIHSLIYEQWIIREKEVLDQAIL